jgi:hypothetical protein
MENFSLYNAGKKTSVNAHLVVVAIPEGGEPVGGDGVGAGTGLGGGGVGPLPSVHHLPLHDEQ